MTELTPQDRRDAMVDQTRLFTETVAGVAADAPVPTCPEWTLAELVDHIGQTQHWVASIVADRVPDPSKLPTDVPPLPDDRDAWDAWLADGASRVAAACSDEAFDEPVWNPAGDASSGTRFWLRRVLAETVIHRADAAAAAGVPYELDAALAADVITDHLAMITSPGWTAMVPESAEAMRGDGQTLHLHATDVPGSGDWIIERGPDAATWRHGTLPDATITVTGPATLLLLVLTRRRPVDAALTEGLHLTGDLDQLTHWVDNTAHNAG